MVVVGGGPTGVELRCALHRQSCRMKTNVGNSVVNFTISLRKTCVRGTRSFPRAFALRSSRRFLPCCPCSASS